MESGLVLEDTDGNPYDLTTALIAFGEVTLREEAKRGVILHNYWDDNVEDIELECVQHPTAQIGKADDTYLATELSTDYNTGYTNILQIPYMSPDETIVIWLKWNVPASAIPGYGQFAIKVRGHAIVKE